MSVLQEGSEIGGFKVQCLIKENEYTESYRVEDKDKKPYFLKLYVLKRTPANLIREEGHEVKEIAILRKIQHVNVVSYINSGSVESPVGECQYVVTSYFTGEVLADRIARDGKLDEQTAMGIFTGILNGLKCLHNAGICHNDISPANIMLSESLQGKPELIDMGHASEPSEGTVPFVTSDLDVRYCANLTASGFFDESTDIFAAFAVLYAMLTGSAPWEIETEGGDTFAILMNRMKRFRQSNPLDLDTLQVSDKLKYMLMVGLGMERGRRYKNVDMVFNELNGEKSDSSCKKSDNETKRSSSRRQSKKGEDLDVELKKGSGRGFEDIAGMQELKNLLLQKVIFVIQNKELAEQYKLLPPNGMLLYGPPGCGKTFFAEKFAEQTAFNFMLVKSSDLASVYVHGSQEKIRDLFKKAEENAPVVLCFDEFDAFVPSRSSTGSASYVSGEVNEFLSQLNNCSEKGIFVVGTTNRPDMIDPAVLRTGRLDKHIFVPLPDHDARKEMFAIHLKGRPFDESAIDFDKLADMTDGYIASDIAFIVNDAATVAAFTKAPITQELIEKSIQCISPSISQSLKEAYEDLRNRMEGVERKNILSEIGFKKR